jgi:hypothetical protein
VFAFHWDLETAKNEYREMISSVKAAWALVGHKLKNHGNVQDDKLSLFYDTQCFQADCLLNNGSMLLGSMITQRWSTLFPPRLMLACAPQP